MLTSKLILAATVALVGLTAGCSSEEGPAQQVGNVEEGEAEEDEESDCVNERRAGTLLGPTDLYTWAFEADTEPNHALVLVRNLTLEKKNATLEADGADPASLLKSYAVSTWFLLKTRPWRNSTSALANTSAVVSSTKSPFHRAIGFTSHGSGTRRAMTSRRKWSSTIPRPKVSPEGPT